MKIRQFLEHHSIAENPFADEDAQTDLIFKGYCITHAYHPTWDKIYGNPAEPATAVVFGEKGSGKTALRLQIARHLADYNADHPGSRVFVIAYDDFNPYLDRFRERFSGRRRKVERVLGEWRLWDHIDAMLSLGVTQLVDRLLAVGAPGHTAALDTQPLPVASLDRSQARDVLLLAACYDQSGAEPTDSRWRRLRKLLRYRTWRSRWAGALGAAVTVAVVAMVVWLRAWSGLLGPWPYLAVAAGWLPSLVRQLRWQWRAMKVSRNTRVLNRNAGQLRKLLARFPGADLVGQPLPAQARTDDRYEMLLKLQNVLRALGFTGIVVLVDRVDEPYQINGSAELMKALVWPMLDNKLLKHPGMGLKMLLPAELVYFVDREERDFHQRARLDKQNLVRSLEWTGESLYDLADARLKAAASPQAALSLEDLFEASVDKGRLIETFRALRVPRHLFKFLYRLMVTHTNAHTDEQPVWQISGETFESVLAVYRRDQEAADRAAGAGEIGAAAGTS